jgi:hypothetical protein
VWKEKEKRVQQRGDRAMDNNMNRTETKRKGGVRVKEDADSVSSRADSCALRSVLPPFEF